MGHLSRSLEPNRPSRIFAKHARLSLVKLLARLTAAAISAAVVVVSPGLGAYEALAQVRTAPAGTPFVAPSGPAAAPVALPVGANPIAGPATLGAMPAALTPAPTLTPAPQALPAAAAGTSPAALPAALPAARPPALPAASRVAGTKPNPKAPVSTQVAEAKASVSSPLTPNFSPAERGRGSIDPKDPEALGRRIGLSRHLEAWRRLGAGRAAEELPDGDSGAVTPSGESGKKALALTPAGRSAEKAAEPATAAPAPAPEGPTQLPRSLWGLFWGHHILTIFGINFHMVSQPFLVMQTLSKSKALMGMVRNVHMGSMSFVNMLPIGWLIDKVDFRVLFIATSLFRALLMGAIPLLFLSGHLTFAVLVGIVAVNPLFQSTMIVADGAARKAFLGTDERLNKEAAAILTKWDSVAGMVFPILSGLAVGWLVTTFGLGGYAYAYGVYALLLLAAIPVYWTMVTDPRERTSLAVTTLGEAARLAGRGLLWLANPKRILGGIWAAIKAFLGLFSRRPAAPAAATADDGAGWKERLARKLDRWEATKGVAYILRNKTLSILMMVGAIEAFLADAMPMVVLPNFITDAIGESSIQIPWLPWALGGLAGVLALRPAWRALSRRVSWPSWLGWLRAKGPVTRAELITSGVLSATLALLAWQLPAMLAAAGGIFSLMLAAEYFGRLISSSKLEGEEGDELIKRWGHGRFYRIAAASASLFWLMWLFPAVLTPGNFWVNLLAVLFVQFGIQLAHAPVGIVMAPVVRREIPDSMLGRVDSAFNMVDLIFMAAGALVAGFAVDLLPINTAMLAIAILISGTAVMEWFVPKWIFPDGNHPGPRSEKDAGGKETARLAVPGDLAFA